MNGKENWNRGRLQERQESIEILESAGIAHQEESKIDRQNRPSQPRTDAFEEASTRREQSASEALQPPEQCRLILFYGCLDLLPRSALVEKELNPWPSRLYRRPCLVPPRRESLGEICYLMHNQRTEKPEESHQRNQGGQEDRC